MLLPFGANALPQTQSVSYNGLMKMKTIFFHYRRNDSIYKLWKVSNNKKKANCPILVNKVVRGSLTMGMGERVGSWG